MSETPVTPPTKRGAIIGTASTFRNTPWNDQSLLKLGLNDLYVLPGLGAFAAWFDLHGIPEMAFRKGRLIHPDDAPVGAYLRPEGHLQWLQTRPFPVYLHDCLEFGCADIPKHKRGHDPYPRPQWKNARSFPYKAIKAQFGEYFSSTPGLMLAWMLLEGFTDIHIYGIHLATEWEYINQRPQLEHLIGQALRMGVTFTIPDKSTLLKGTHIYGKEPKANLALERVQRLVDTLKVEGQQIQVRLQKAPWYATQLKADLRRRLQVLNVELVDARQEQARLTAVSRVA